VAPDKLHRIDGYVRVSKVAARDVDSETYQTERPQPREDRGVGDHARNRDRRLAR
jgi:hypothetical protein